MVEKRGNSLRFYSWLTLVIIGVGLGLWGVITLLVDGHSTTGASSQVPWGIFVSTYVFFVAASAGSMIVMLGYALGIKRFAIVMKRTVFLAIVTVLAGGVLIILDLGSPQSILNTLTSPNFSTPLWWMVVFYALYLILLLLQYYFITKNDHGKLRVMSIFTAISAIAVHSTLSSIFGFAAVRSYFGGAFAPVYFILIALVIGTALILFITILQQKLNKKSLSSDLNGIMMDLGKFLGILLTVTIFFIIWKDLIGIGSTVATTELAYEHILGSWWYWLVIIAIGLAIPAILLLNPKTRTPNMIMVSSIFVLIGMFMARFEFIIGGQLVPVLQNLTHLEYPLGSYVPTFIEIAVVIFAFSGVILVYTVGTRVMSLEKAPQHE